MLKLWLPLLLCFLLTAHPVQAQNATLPDSEAAQLPPAPARSSNPARELSPAQLLAELRRGGYVLYFRHTSPKAKPRWCADSARTSSKSSRASAATPGTL